jgi:hypothetical protein
MPDESNLQEKAHIHIALRHDMQYYQAGFMRTEGSITSPAYKRYACWKNTYPVMDLQNKAQIYIPLLNIHGIIRSVYWEWLNKTIKCCNGLLILGLSNWINPDLRHKRKQRRTAPVGAGPVERVQMVVRTQPEMRIRRLALVDQPSPPSR